MTLFRTIAALSLSTFLGCVGASCSRQSVPDPAPEAAATTPAATNPIAALIGKAAPPISVARWVKGTPITGFEKGKVYVVDFWATWCGPCKAAIPHLTDLAQKYPGRVEIIGVSILEKQKDAADNAYIDLVQRFVDKQGDRMGYRVAVDTPDKQMQTTWFKPAGTGGIPTAYIIDQNGRIAWIGIGDPKTVERIVGEVLAGTFDYSKEAEVQRTADAEARKRSEADIAASKKAGNSLYDNYPGYKEAMDRGDQAAALESLNAAFKAHPESETGGAYQWKFMILMQRNKPEEVNAYVQELLTKYPDNGDIMGFASACIVSASDDAPRFDPHLALQTAQKSAALAKPDTRWAQFTKWRLGWAYFKVGEKDKAIESMQAARDGVAKLKGTIDFGDLDSEIQDALRVFNKKAASAGEPPARSHAVASR